MAETATTTDFYLTLERLLAAPRERVYKAWTNKLDCIAQYLREV